jgi:hypothetical protein
MGLMRMASEEVMVMALNAVIRATVYRFIVFPCVANEKLEFGLQRTMNKKISVVCMKEFEADGRTICLLYFQVSYVVNYRYIKSGV